MKHRLNLDIKDPNYTLLKEILILEKSSEILASCGFKNLNNQILPSNHIYQHILWIKHFIHFK